MRTGIIAEKMGMTRLYLSDGTHVPVTVLRVDNCHVIANKREKNGHYSITLGSGSIKAKNVLKPQREAYAKIKVEPKKKMVEFKVSEENIVEIGKELGVEHFVVGQYIDATGISIGKGFAGSMKRHNFSGLRASHGVSISHRSHGSTGNSQDPGRVFKGKKMAGHMGSHKTTIQNLQVVGTDAEKGLLLIKGGVPGSNGSWLSIKDAVKKALPSDAPYPAGIKGMKANKVKTEAEPSEESTAKKETKPSEESTAKKETKPSEEIIAKKETKPSEESSSKKEIAPEGEKEIVVTSQPNNNEKNQNEVDKTENRPEDQDKK